VRLYLDIDGVLLGKGGSLPANVHAFLTFVTANFDCHWLTTHCKGDAKTAIRYLAQHYPADWLPMLASIHPTHWDTLKTEGIDLQTPFIWLDDQPMQAERHTLTQHNCTQSLWVVDLKNEHHALQQIMRQLLALLV
jgi:hypothetical protein